MLNQKGVIPLLLLIGVIGVLGVLTVVSIAPFKNTLLSTLFPKQGSYAFGSDDWVTRGGDFNRGYFRPTPLALTSANKLNLQWKKFLGERIEVEMEPIIVGNSIFIGVMNGKVYSLNKSTGATQWVFQTGGPLTDTPTAFTSTSGQLRLAVPSTDGKLYVLDGSNGQKIWEYQTGAALMSSPAFNNNTIFVGSMDYKFYAFDASDSSVQRVKWSYQTTGPISTTSALGDLGNGQMGLFVANGSNMAYGFNINGTKLWEKQMGGAYTKRTTAVYGGGKVIFVTKKPGRENSSVTEDVPSLLSGNTKQPIGTVINTFADFYNTYPERRTFYVFNALTGADMWNPTGDKTKYAPLYIPYWGEYAPVVDTSTNSAYYPITTGYGAGNVLDHDFRLIKLDLATGNMTQVGANGGANVRFDEFGRMNLIGTRLFQTMNEDIGYFDISTLTLNSGVFGTFSDGRYPLELSELPNPAVFGGMEKHFTRFGGSSTSAYGGGNDEVSPLIVSGNQAFMITMGHLYAFTGQPVATLSKEYLPLDLISGPPSLISDKTQVKQMLTAQIQQIVTANKHIDPVSRFWNYSQNLNSIDVNFWHEGEIVRALSEAVPLVDEPVKSQLKAYLKTEVQNQLLNANLYQFRRACLNFKTKTVEDPCTNANINSGWYWSNYLLTGKRLYALYKYAQMTGDWTLIQNNWNFIKARFADITPSSQYDANAGFFLYQGFVSGPFSPDIQMGAMLGVSEMAKQVGDTATQASADNYLNVMKQKRPYWGKYVRSLYDSGVLSRTDFPDKNDWGVNQNIFIPKEGYMDKTNDFRQPYSITKNTDGTFKVDYSNVGAVFPYTLVGFGPFYPEFGDFINQNLGDELKDYTDMLERYDAWWYMGDMNHQPINGQHEEESLSPQIAPAIFQAKAYVFKQSFDQLKNYLPWTFENYGYNDIYRIQNMVALLNAAGGDATPSSLPSPSVQASSASSKPGDIDGNSKVDIFDYNILLTNFGKSGAGIQGDLDGSNKVDIFDYNGLLTNFGK